MNDSKINQSELEMSVAAQLRENLQATELKVVDCGGHMHHGSFERKLSVEIASPLFAGKSLIEQHRMIYSCLQDELKEQIHALSIKTKIAK